MLIGNILLGLGISIFKLSGLGNDPFSGMVMALSEVVNIPYATFLVILNIFVFIIQFLTGRKLIGIGTIVNACLLGYVVTLFFSMLQRFSLTPETMWQRIIVVCIGVVVTSLGVSMYQTPKVGIAPYDSLSIIMARRWVKIPYFWHRMLTDGICAAICFTAGGIVGLGTLVSAFGLGPFIHFFNEHVSKKLI
jgi:uncharacterized membrane protein YczE